MFQIRCHSLVLTILCSLNSLLTTQIRGSAHPRRNPYACRFPPRLSHQERYRNSNTQCSHHKNILHPSTWKYLDYSTSKISPFWLRKYLSHQALSNASLSILHTPFFPDICHLTPDSHHQSAGREQALTPVHLWSLVPYYHQRRKPVRILHSYWQRISCQLIVLCACF